MAPSSTALAAFLASIQATAKVMLVAGAGVVVCRLGRFAYPARKGLSLLGKDVLLPALLLARVGAVATVDSLVAWWPLAVFEVIYSGLGLLLGHVVYRAGAAAGLVDRARVDARFFAVSAAFSNCTSLPLALVEALVLTYPPLTRAGETADAVVARGVAYIMVMTLYANIARWTVAYNLLAPPSSRAATGEPKQVGGAKPAAALELQPVVVSTAIVRRDDDGNDGNGGGGGGGGGGGCG